jgi:hypothetical protein
MGPIAISTIATEGEHSRPRFVDQAPSIVE